MTEPLSDIVILDLSRLFPGGFCSLQLVDLGARVIKIEEPGVGDFYRAGSAKALMGEGYFAALNRGKESLSLNLKTPAGKKIFLKLLRSADVVIESFRPGRLKKLGLDYASLKRANRKIILCSISGYGQTGPYAQQAGHDINYMGYSGLLSLTGDAGDPSLPGFQLADLAGGGLYGVLAILAALRERDQSGQGTWIDLSMTEGALSLAGVHLTGESWEGHPKPQGKGLLNGGSVAYQIYRTRDGKAVALAALEAKFWAGLRQLIKLPEGLRSGFDVGAFKSDLKRRLRDFFVKHNRAELLKLAAPIEMCLSPVLTLAEVVRDPHLLARRIFSFFKGPGGRSIPFVRSPWRFNGKRRAVKVRAPRLGQHSRIILSELGYTNADLKEFRKEGVI